MERAGQLVAQLAVERLPRHVLQRAEARLPVGVADERVDVRAGVHQCGCLLGVEHVRLDGPRGASRGLDVLDHGARRGGVADIVDDHVESAAAELPGRRGADAPAGPRDQCDSAHARPSLPVNGHEDRV
jgi:hypothetical protein